MPILSVAGASPTKFTAQPNQLNSSWVEIECVYTKLRVPGSSVGYFVIAIFFFFFFFFFFKHRLSTPVGTPSLSMQVKIQPTCQTLGMDFYEYGPFFYPTIKVTILQLRGAVEKFWKKDRLKITEGRKKEKNLGEQKESMTGKRNP